MGLTGAAGGEGGDPQRYIEIKIKAVLAEIESLQAQLDDVIDKAVARLSKKVEEEVKKKKDGLDNADPTTHDAESRAAGTADVRNTKHLEKMRASLDSIADVGVGFIKKTFGLVEMLYAQLKKSSPLLQAIEQLFNLAWSLFFMPIGNKLGELLIPAVIQLMDDVMEIWDAFEGMTLGEMVEYAIEHGVVMLAEFIDKIAVELEGNTGLVGAIGRMLETLSGFLKNDAAKLLSFLVDFASFIIDHIKELIAVIVGFKVAALGMMVTQILVTAASAMKVDVAGATAWTIALAGLAASADLGIMAGMGTYAHINSYAEGGYVPATPGGRLAIVGEGGEGEYIIPESKAGMLGGSGNSYTINIYSYSTDEIKTIVREVVSDEISQSRLRSGY